MPRPRLTRAQLFPERRNARRLAAEKRTQDRATRTSQEQIVRLDQMFGVGLGAKKERAKLQARINKVHMQEITPDGKIQEVKVLDKTSAEMLAREPKQKVKAKDRRAAEKKAK